MHNDASHKAEGAQQSYFRVTDSIPEQTWYWLALASIGVSAALKVAEKDHWALFVGQWPPTFLLFGIFHRITGLGKS
ncbi:MAG TPA: hypothetical protein VNZ55_02985 [Thermomicrobiales bacterium]|nr:hypothetical protein [Thermomicrobiales bacterium]